MAVQTQKKQQQQKRQQQTQKATTTQNQAATKSVRKSRSERRAELLKRTRPEVKEWKAWQKGGMHIQFPPAPPPQPVVPLPRDDSSNLLDTIWGGIKTGWNAFTGALSSLANSIGGLFSGSNSTSSNTPTPTPTSSTTSSTSNSPAYSLPPVMDKQSPAATVTPAAPIVVGQASPSSSASTSPSAASQPPSASTASTPSSVSSQSPAATVTPAAPLVTGQASPSSSASASSPTASQATSTSTAPTSSPASSQSPAANVTPAAPLVTGQTPSTSSQTTTSSKRKGKKSAAKSTQSASTKKSQQPAATTTQQPAATSAQTSSANTNTATQQVSSQPTQTSTTTQQTAPTSANQPTPQPTSSSSTQTSSPQAAPVSTNQSTSPPASSQTTPTINYQTTPASNQPYQTSGNRPVQTYTNQPTYSNTTYQATPMYTNSSFPQGSYQTYPTSNSQQQPNAGTSNGSPGFWATLWKIAQDGGNVLGTVASAPFKAISGNTSSLSLPATMDEYNSRYYKAYQMFGGNPYSDVNAYGGIDQVPVPYLSQDQIINSQDLTADVDNNVLQLAPIIAGKIRRLNPYASDDDIRYRTVDALGSIRTLMLTHAINQRQKYELLKAVENGDPSQFTPEQIQQLQQMGVIDQNGKLMPGAHASAQGSLAANFDDAKNQYPTVFTIASSAKPSETNLQAMASRSARTGVLDTNMFAPEVVPMYGATPPPAVAGVQAHLSRQGSISAGLSQPQVINIGSGPTHRPGSQTTNYANSVKLGTSMINSGVYLIFDADKIKTGEQLLGLGVAGMKNSSTYIPRLAEIIKAGQAVTASNYKISNQELETIFINAKDDKYRDKNTGQIDRSKIKGDIEKLLKPLGIKSFSEYINILTNSRISPLQTSVINRLVDFLTQTLGTIPNTQWTGDEYVMDALRQDLADALNQNDPVGAAMGKIQQYQKTAARLLQGLDDPDAWKALYKLNLIAALDPNWQLAMVPSQAAHARMTGVDYNNAANALATALRKPFTGILGGRVTQHLYNHPDFVNNYVIPQTLSIMINSINAVASRAW